MIYIDNRGHMVANTLDELHRFARKIGLKRTWFQDKKHPHYDLTTQRMIDKAIINGAVPVSSREIIRILRRGVDR